MIILKVPITISTTKCIIFIFKKNRKKAEKAKKRKIKRTGNCGSVQEQEKKLLYTMEEILF